MRNSSKVDRSYALPPVGDNPSSQAQGTTPGSFANAGRVGTPWAYSSPDTPGMPGVSDLTAMDFASARDREGKTQLEQARSGVVSAEMKRVALHEAHLTAEQIRAEVATGRMIVPANKVHLKYKLQPMCIGRAGLTKINANMGASPVSSGTAEEVEKLRWAEKWGADTVMDLSTGGDLDACRQAIIRKFHRAHRNRPHLFDDHWPLHRGFDLRPDSQGTGKPGQAGRGLFHDSRRRFARAFALSCASG